MSVLLPCLIGSSGPGGEAVVRLGVPLVDDDLEFLAGRCRPNTVLAAGYDLKVFFTVQPRRTTAVTTITVRSLNVTSEMPVGTLDKQRCQSRNLFLGLVRVPGGYEGDQLNTRQA